jgi:hypothetical protein
MYQNTCSIISNGQVSLNTFGWNPSEYSTFTGSGTFTVTLAIYEKANITFGLDTGTAQRVFQNVSVTNGGATINWASGITP